MTLLLVAGVGVILVGLAAIGFGIPVKEFGFGNTLILTGTVATCTGLIMVSLAIVVRELKSLAPQLAGQLVPQPRRDTLVPNEAQAESSTDQDEPAREGALFSRDQPAVERAAATDAAAPPWQHDASRERARNAAPAEEPAAPAEPKRRNLLFQSSVRKPARSAEPAAGDSAAADTPGAPPFSFEDAWPQIERAPRPEAPGRPARTPSTFRDTPAEPVPAPRQSDAAAEVTVLKSGVVDGMAYSLYSDGSIEAEMPEGKMHFASIDELREHLDQRG
jgi:hypothetical protein